jgi:hypothetical protein
VCVCVCVCVQCVCVCVYTHTHTQYTRARTHTHTALEEEDMADLAFPPSNLATKEAVVEVVCHTEFKTQVQISWQHISNTLATH